jgi:hypothetical protein
MKSIILIGGKAESGKDSVAEMLKNKLNEKVFILHYGDYVKFVCKEYFNWNGEKDEVGRHILQTIGTDKIRTIKDDFWIEAVCNLVKVLKNDYDLFIVPDLRFLNEIHIPSRMFWNYKIITVKVERNNYTSELTEEQNDHVSETELNNYNFDYVIQSESGLDNLETEVDKFIPWLNEKISNWKNKKEKRSR